MISTDFYSKEIASPDFLRFSDYIVVMISSLNTYPGHARNDDEETPFAPLFSEVANVKDEESERTRMIPHERGAGPEHTRIRTVHRWGNKILDLKEAKSQFLFSLPMIITDTSYYAVSLVSVMFAGHLGDLQLAGASLANSFFSVTGVDVVIGLSGALETFCGQGYGAKEYDMLGMYLQASCIISLVFSIVVSVIWYFTDSILILLHQSPEISSGASLYMKFLIPGLFALGIVQNMLRFLQTQSVVWPLVALSTLPLLLHIGFAYVLIHLTPLSFKGAPISVTITCWASTLLLALYVMKSKRFKDTWKGLSFKSFHYIFIVLKLALPSAAMLCLEFWAFEILVFLAGLLPESEITTPLIAICVNTEAIGCMISYGLAAAASTRVANELGADKPERAKHAMGVSLKISFLLTMCFVATLLLGQGIWIQLFSSSSVMKKEFASMAPLLAISILLESMQGVLSGVARGCGWQYSAVYINLASYYFIALPISCLLGFKSKLHARGLWIGLICGMLCQTGSLLILTKYAKWKKLSV